MISLKINGSQHDVDVDADMPLLWAIRDVLNMTGTKFGCGIAQCGACTVHLDGQPVRSCQTQVGDAAGHEITTIEGVNGKVAHAVQAAWQDLDVLTQTPKPSDADIESAMDGNVCRCATYPRIRAAIHAASAKLA